jgi:hypothetical protein
MAFGCPGLPAGSLYLSPAGRGRFAPGDANGSRECAPDDRLHIVQCKSGEGTKDYETVTPHPKGNPKGEGAHFRCHCRSIQSHLALRKRSEVDARPALPKSGVAPSFRLVRDPFSGPAKDAVVAQLVRAPVCGTGGRWFEPTQLYQKL